MKVTKLPIDPGVSGWNAILPDRPAPTVLEDAITADWLIIGAGYAGLFTPGCAIIQPALYVRSLADALRNIGVQVFENSPVVSLERRGDWVAKTPSGQVTAPKVILAVNGHLNSFGFAKRQFMHVFTYGSMTRALSEDEVERLGGAENWGVTPSDPLGSSVRKIAGTGGHRIIVRNRFTYDPAMEVSDAKVARMGRSHDRSFDARFPMLKGVEMEYRWGGRLCVSYNDVQLISELDEGLFSACCQNGLGTAKGTLAGLLVAEMAHGIDSPELRNALGEEAPSKLPPEPLMNIGANAYLRWQEKKAGAEL